MKWIKVCSRKTINAFFSLKTAWIRGFSLLFLERICVCFVSFYPHKAHKAAPLASMNHTVLTSVVIQWPIYQIWPFCSDLKFTIYWFCPVNRKHSDISRTVKSRKRGRRLPEVQLLARWTCQRRREIKTNSLWNLSSAIRSLKAILEKNLSPLSTLRNVPIALTSSILTVAAEGSVESLLFGRFLQFNLLI